MSIFLIINRETSAGGLLSELLQAIAEECWKIIEMDRKRVTL